MRDNITEWGILLFSVKVAMSNVMDWFTTARDPIIVEIDVRWNHR